MRRYAGIQSSHRACCSACSAPENPMVSVSGKVIGACFALSAFTVAIAAGLSSGSPTAQILLRAVGCMIVCYATGFVVGALCARAIWLHVSQPSDAVRASGAGDAAVSCGGRTADTRELEVIEM